MKTTRSADTPILELREDELDNVVGGVSFPPTTFDAPVAIPRDVWAFRPASRPSLASVLVIVDTNS